MDPNNHAVAIFENLVNKLASLSYRETPEIEVGTFKRNVETAIRARFGEESDYLRRARQVRFLVPRASRGNKPTYFKQAKQRVEGILNDIILELKLSEGNQQDAFPITMHAVNTIPADPIWKRRNFNVDPRLCFLLMPFSQPWSTQVWGVMKRAATDSGLKPQRADEKDGVMVMEDVWEGICTARVIIADLTNHNPNVTYEAGIVNTLGKPIVLISQNAQDEIVFDFLGQRIIFYDLSDAGLDRLHSQLSARLDALTGS